VGVTVRTSAHGSQGAMLHRYMADHAKDQTPGTMLEAVHGTFKRALEGARNNPPDMVGPAFYGLMRLDDFVATRSVEAPCRARCRRRSSCRSNS
jgi:hypothetical protein